MPEGRGFLDAMPVRGQKNAMAGPGNALVNFGDIMQAVEDKLVADGVVDDDSQITWGTPDNVPQLSGPFDVVLVARNATHTPYDGGSLDLRLTRYLDVYVRSQSIGDPGGGLKAWLMEQFAKGDAVINSVGNDDFWPEDSSGNLLTIESIKLAGDVAPMRTNNVTAFGDYVATLECKYLPMTTNLA